MDRGRSGRRSSSVVLTDVLLHLPFVDLLWEGLIHRVGHHRERRVHVHPALSRGRQGHPSRP
eukprot:227205-Prorocentrum_minimum.AAC.1